MDSRVKQESVPLYADSDVDVRKGDKVIVKRRWFKPLQGTVIQVYDPSQPPTLDGHNQFGFCVECIVKDWRNLKVHRRRKRLMFHFDGKLIEKVEFIRRRKEGD